MPKYILTYEKPFFVVRVMGEIIIKKYDLLETLLQIEHISKTHEGYDKLHIDIAPEVIPFLGIIEQYMIED